MGSRRGIEAIVLAAGYSSRMAEFKPLLPIGDTVMIEMAVNSIRQAGINNITVVSGHRADELTPVLERLQVRSVFNKNYDSGMLSSIIAGLRSLPTDTEAFLMLPGDMSLVRSHTIRLLCRMMNKSRAAVYYPIFQGQRGHPVLITASCFPDILAGEHQASLRVILEQYEEKAYEIEVFDEGILIDADTPDDYRRITEFCCRRYFPSQAECRAILSSMMVSDDVEKHGRVVAKAAEKLAGHLNQSGLDIDVNLVTAAGMLHDLAKGRPAHARVGSRILAKAGFPQVAKIVAVHTDIEFNESMQPDEAAIVYLADKMVRGDRMVSITERFQSTMEKFPSAEVPAFIQQRLSMAQSISKSIECILGVSLDEVMKGG